VLAAVATAWMADRPTAGVALAVAAFVLIGVGVGAGGTSLLALLAKRVAPERRPAAGSIVWMMMIAGFVVTALLAGHFLDPFTPLRLVQVTGCVAAVAFLVSVAAVWGVEPRGRHEAAAAVLDEGSDTVTFRMALSEVWADAPARHFTLFVFVSMLAYSAQDLILEPFAGVVFGMTPGESTQLSGIQNAGVLAGMLIIAVCGTLFPGRTVGSLRFWILTGCTGSALALGALGAAGLMGPTWPLSQSVFLLGLANGAFAVAAIGAMMALAGAGRRNREGVRMGLWGAAQAMAFALGGFAGTLMLDVLRWALDGSTAAYSFVFAAEALLFLAAARMAADIDLPSRQPTVVTPSPAGDIDWRYTS
jgi:BCD family chlorophyll transporter-like MFS transporter